MLFLLTSFALESKCKNTQNNQTDKKYLQKKKRWRRASVNVKGLGVSLLFLDKGDDPEEDDGADDGGDDLAHEGAANRQFVICCVFNITLPDLQPSLFLVDGMIGKVHNPMQRYTYGCTTTRYTAKRDPALLLCFDFIHTRKCFRTFFFNSIIFLYLCP